jgi:hypothetical protein
VDQPWTERLKLPFDNESEDPRVGSTVGLLGADRFGPAGRNDRAIAGGSLNERRSGLENPRVVVE